MLKYQEKPKGGSNSNVYQWVEWRDKLPVIYTCSGTVFNHKKEQNTDACCYLDERKKPGTKGHILYDCNIQSFYVV